MTYVNKYWDLKYEYKYKYWHLKYKYKYQVLHVCHYAVQGHTRSPILVPIESPYATSY